MALAGVAAVQIALGLALFSGLRVTIARPPEVVQRLIEIALPASPPRVPITTSRRRRSVHAAAVAPRAERKPAGGSPGPAKSRETPAVAPIVALRPAAAPPGGGTGSGPASGVGAGGGPGGQGFGGDEDGSDIELIAGAILPSDYPRELGNAGIGGRVSVTFTVQVNGQPTGCRVTRSSGTPRLDALTCRIIEQRFRFRPSTDRHGRAIPDEVDWDHDWIPSSRRY